MKAQELLERIVRIKAVVSTRAVSGSLKAVFKRYWQQYHSQGLSVHDDFHEQAWDGVLQPTGYCRVHGNGGYAWSLGLNEAEGQWQCAKKRSRNSAQKSAAMFISEGRYFEIGGKFAGIVVLESAVRNSSSYYDIFMFDLNGDLIYSVFKETDYATNFLIDGDGPWKDSGLGE
ncbi:unnamed protein product, partial [Symbiodinium microadriaticum]